MTKIIYVLHDKSEVDSVDDNNRRLTLAKRVTTKNLDRFFLFAYNSKVIDPSEITARQLQNGSTVQIEVSQEIYQKYLKVLAGTTRTTFKSIERMISQDA